MRGTVGSGSQSPYESVKTINSSGSNLFSPVAEPKQPARRSTPTVPEVDDDDDYEDDDYDEGESDDESPAPAPRQRVEKNNGNDDDDYGDEEAAERRRPTVVPVTSKRVAPVADFDEIIDLAETPHLPSPALVMRAAPAPVPRAGGLAAKARAKAAHDEEVEAAALEAEEAAAAMAAAAAAKAAAAKAARRARLGPAGEAAAVAAEQAAAAATAAAARLAILTQPLKSAGEDVGEDMRDFWRSSCKCSLGFKSLLMLLLTALGLGLLAAGLPASGPKWYSQQIIRAATGTSTQPQQSYFWCA